MSRSLNRLIAIIGIALLWAMGCEQYSLEKTSQYPIEKTFPTNRSSWTFEGKGKGDLSLDIFLSFKADSLCHYKIKAATVGSFIKSAIEGKERNNHLSIRFVDKNNLILYDLAPSWNVYDTRDISPSGVTWRGSFKIQQEIFEEISQCEVYFK